MRRQLYRKWVYVLLAAMSITHALHLDEHESESILEDVRSEKEEKSVAAKKLSAYTKKRDLEKSPEPQARVKSSKGENIFVIQQHHASHMHFDLRLEMGGVLKSWAVPKGPSTDPSEKRLAVLTEDHPLDYATFEGIIPEGYGAGSVIVWDTGTYENLSEKNGKNISMQDAFDKGHIKVMLHGKKLKGTYALTHFKDKNWLLVKMKDEYANAKTNPARTKPKSVLSKATIKELDKKKSKKTVMPSFEQPMLATLTKDYFNDKDWIFERKFDGVRCLIFKDGDHVTLKSRNNNSMNSSYPELLDPVRNLSVNQVILDGEIVAFKGNYTSFEKLQGRIGLTNAEKARATGVKIYIYIFDILYLDGQDLTKLPLITRKAILKKEIPFSDPLRYTVHINERGADYFPTACSKKWEGLIAKKRDGIYEHRRSKNWLKFKCVANQELVIAGYTEPAGSRTGFGALLMGYYKNGVLHFAGKVGTGFSDSFLQEFGKKLKKIEIKKNPFSSRELSGNKTARSNLPKNLQNNKVHFVKPIYVAEIGFEEWTRDNKLRQPRFLGLRLDKDAKKVVKEEPDSKMDTNKKKTASKKLQPKKSATKKTKKVKEIDPPAKHAKNKSAKKHANTHRSSKKDASKDQLDGSFSNLDKIYYPDSHKTKQDVLAYYQKVADYFLEHSKDHLMVMQRFPSGIDGESFFQKQTPDYFPRWIKRRAITLSDGTKQELVVLDSPDSLLYLANQGVLVFHSWLSSKGSVNKPDKIVFDLDPAKKDLKNLRFTARELKKILEDHGLVPFVMTTGSKGYHVVAPIIPEHSFEKIHEFAKHIATELAEKYPTLLTTQVSKAARQGRIFIDYLRNSFGQTSVAPYSLRATKNASVATPIEWEELSKTKPDKYTINSIFKRLARKGDAWENFEKSRKKLKLGK